MRALRKARRGVRCIPRPPLAGRHAALACLQQQLHGLPVASICGFHERGHARLVLKEEGREGG